MNQPQPKYAIGEAVQASSWGTKIITKRDYSETHSAWFYTCTDLSQYWEDDLVAIKTTNPVFEDEKTEEVDTVVRCPKCKSKGELNLSFYKCSFCGHEFPFMDGWVDKDEEKMYGYKRR